MNINRHYECSDRRLYVAETWMFEQRCWQGSCFMKLERQALICLQRELAFGFTERGISNRNLPISSFHCCCKTESECCNTQLTLRISYVLWYPFSWLSFIATLPIEPDPYHAMGLLLNLEVRRFPRDPRALSSQQGTTSCAALTSQ